MNAIQRISHLIKIDCVTHKKLIGNYLLLLCLFWFVSAFLSMSFYYTAAYVMGIFFVLTLLTPLHNTAQAASYFTLPVQNSERLLAKWLLSAPIALAAIFAIAGLGNLLVPGLSIAPAHPSFVTIFLIYNAIFLLGGLMFRTHPLAKTMTLLLLAMTVFVLIVFALKDVWPTLALQLGPWFADKPQLLFGMVKLAFFSIIPVLLYLSYRRLCRMEVA